jgi:hypothetical protein
MADRFDTRFDRPQRLYEDAAGRDIAGRDVASFDAGLRKHMLSVYNYMASGVLWTGIVALLFATSGMTQALFSPYGGMSLLGWVVMLSPLAFILVLSFGIHRLSTGTMQILYWAFATVMGLSLSTIFLRFTGASIAQVFFATSAAFAGLSLWGYTTKRDLSGMGTFLIMGAIGLLVAILINLFLQSPVMHMAISAIGVLIFAGLTAYDTQKIKSIYFQVQGTEFLGKAAIMGALDLYLDFVNMFTFLLNLMGSRE